MKRWLWIFVVGLAAVYFFNPASVKGWAPLARLLGVSSFSVPYAWMEPALTPGDHILVNLRAYRVRPPTRGDIVVFAYPNDKSRLYLGRVIGVAGDTVAIEDGTVTIDGQPQVEPYLHAVPQAPYSLAMVPITVPSGQLFVLGDNRDRSKDSRIWGFLPVSAVLGRARYIWLAADRNRIGPLH